MKISKQTREYLLREYKKSNKPVRTVFKKDPLESIFYIMIVLIVVRFMVLPFLMFIININ